MVFLPSAIGLALARIFPLAAVFAQEALSLLEEGFSFLKLVAVEAAILLQVFR